MSAKNNDNEITDHDAAGLVIASAQEAYKKMPGRVMIKQGLVGGKKSIQITLVDFMVANGAVLDLVANGGKPEVQDGGK
mgnify:FL=1